MAVGIVLKCYKLKFFLNNKREANLEENNIMKELNSNMNSNIAFRNHKEYLRQYNIGNREILSQKQKECNEKNKEKIAKNQKRYYEDNKENLFMWGFGFGRLR